MIGRIRLLLLLLMFVITFKDITKTIALKSNGTVIACGDNSEKRINIREWRNVIDLSMGTHHTVGLLSDKTIITCGEDGQQRCSGTKGWTDIVSIECGAWHTLGIRADGTVLACGNNKFGSCNTESWKLFKNIETIEEERIKAKKRFDLMIKLRDKADKIFEGLPHLLVSESGKVTVISKDEEYRDCESWNNIVAVTEELYCTSGLCKDGTVLSAGSKSDGKCNTEYWTDIVDVTRKGGSYVVGLKADGTVEACGYNLFGQCNVQNWRDISAIKCFHNRTYGIKRNGMIVSCGDNEFGACNVQDWNNVVSVLGTPTATFGLCIDGTVLACGDSSLCQKVSKWSHIIQLSCGLDWVVGLCDDGTVVLATESRVIELEGWENIVSVAAGHGFVLGLCDNGKVLSYGNSSYGATNVAELKNIVAISANGYSAYALDCDGTVYISQTDGWKKIHIFNDLCFLADDTERVAVSDSERKAIEERMNQKRLSRQKSGVCIHCGGEFKGLLSKKCVNCGKAKDY